MVYGHEMTCAPHYTSEAFASPRHLHPSRPSIGGPADAEHRCATNIHFEHCTLDKCNRPLQPSIVPSPRPPCRRILVAAS